MAGGRKTSQLNHGTPTDDCYIDYVDPNETLPADRDKTVLISTLKTLMGDGTGGGGGEEETYTNLNPTQDQNLHIPPGTTFNGVTHNDVFDMLLYSLNASLVAENTPRLLGSSNAVVLDWSVVRSGDPITGITVAGQTISPTGNSQSGTVDTTATQNATTIFSMTVTDGDNVLTKQTSVSWLNNRYIGTSPEDGLTAGQGISDADIQGWTAELSGTRAQTRNAYDGNSEYIYLAWPTRFGAGQAAIDNLKIKVNGQPVNSWVVVRTNSNYTNEAGYTEPYEVIRTPTIQPSSINLEVLA